MKSSVDMIKAVVVLVVTVVAAVATILVALTGLLVTGVALFALVSSHTVVIHPSGPRMCEQLAKVGGFKLSIVQLSDNDFSTDHIPEKNSAIFYNHNLTCLLLDREMDVINGGQTSLQKADQLFSLDTYSCFKRSDSPGDNVHMRRVMCTEFPATLMCEVVCQHVHVHTVCAFISGNRSCVFTTKQKQHQAVKAIRKQSRSHHGCLTKGSDASRKKRQMKCMMVSRLPTTNNMKMHARDSFHVNQKTVSKYTSLKHPTVSGKRPGYIRRCPERCEFSNSEIDNYLNGKNSINCIKFGNIPLMYAIVSNNLGLFNYLLVLGSKFERWGYSKSVGQNLFYQACRYCRPRMVKTLVDLGFDVESRRKPKSMTPILSAASTGCFDVVIYLYKIGCNITVVDKEKQSILYHAILGKNVSLVHFLLDLQVGRAMLELTGPFKYTPFLLAVDKNALKIINLLVEKGCDVSARDGSGRTALHLASERGLLQMVKYIISLKVLDTDCTDMNGKTPLHVASDRGFTYIVDYLKKQAEM